MPTTLTTQALPNNTYIITADFTDDDGDPVTPNAGAVWGMTDNSGNVINSRADVNIVEDTSIDIVLTDDDLAAQGAEDDGIRVVTIEGDYDSSAGNGLTLDKATQFAIADVQLPVTLQDAKAQLCLTGDDVDDDIDISLRIKTARQWVEEYTQSKLITQTVTKYWQEWPEFFDIPYGNLQSVTSIKYKDTDGAQSTWSSDEYIVEKEESLLRGRVVLGYAESYPSVTLYPSNPIAVEYICGYGTTKGDVPGPVKDAIRVMIADSYLLRENYVVGTIATPLKTTENLLSQYRFGSL